jgi:acyl-CoA dehydrogenase
MSEMIEIILDSATKIFEKHSGKEIINDSEKGKWAKTLWSSLEEYGMLGVAVPEELGGSGGDVEDAFGILRLAGQFSAPIPLAETYMANWLLTRYGKGVPISSEIITVPFPKNMSTFQFQEHSEGWIVNGHAEKVPWARFAKRLLVVGETLEGSVLSLVDLDHAKITHGTNMAGEARDNVVFDNVILKDCKTIEIDNEEIVNEIFHIGALTRSVMMAGALEKTIELAVNHTTERSQFGRPIHRFQAIQHQLAHLAGEVAAANTAANGAVNTFASNPLSKEIAFSKIRVNEAAGKSAQIAHQVLAAIGFTYEHTLHHFTRRLWSWRDEYGTEADWEKVVTEKLLKLEKNGLWSMITGVQGAVRKVDTK